MLVRWPSIFQVPRACHSDELHASRASACEWFTELPTLSHSTCGIRKWHFQMNPYTLLSRPSCYAQTMTARGMTKYIRTPLGPFIVPRAKIAQPLEERNKLDDNYTYTHVVCSLALMQPYGEQKSIADSDEIQFSRVSLDNGRAWGFITWLVSKSGCAHRARKCRSVWSANASVINLRRRRAGRRDAVPEEN